MKKKNYFMLALASMAFVACTNDDVLSGDGTDTGLDPNGDAWVSLDIRTPATVNSRALNTPDQENGITGEYEIESVKAFFFNGPDATSTVTKIINLNSGFGTPGGDGNTGAAAPSDAFLIPTTSKTILIVANPGSIDFTGIDVGDTFKKVNAAVEGSISAVAESGKFLMTNAKGDLEPSDGYGNTTQLKLHSTPEAAKGSPLAINVDRVVAKVRVFTDKTSTVAEVFDAGWVLNVTNKWFYPVSKRVMTWNEDPANFASGGRGSCITPYDQYRLGSYRIDPNHDSSNIGEWDETEVGNPAGYDKVYNYYTTATPPGSTGKNDWNDLNPLNPGVGDPLTAEYCLENTQEAKYNVHSYTTHVLLKANFAPKNIKTMSPAGVEGRTDVAKDENWMIISGGYYTYATLLDWIEYELRNKYADGNPDKYNVPVTNEFNKYLDAIGVGKVTLTTKEDYDLTPANTPEAEANKLRLLFVAKEDAVKGKGGQEKGDVTYYLAGVSYYKIMIKHDDTPKIMNEYGEFGVVRNSVYDVRITKFNNPGYPIIPKPDPNKPDETDEEWLSIQINVNPWTWYKQETEL